MRFLTAGESHGKCLNVIMEGIPAGMHLSSMDIDKELKRRQKGYGRGGRMRIERDRAIINSGVRAGVTLGSPVSVTIQNKDWENWQTIMSPEAVEAIDIEARRVTRPRPGHADLAGGIKYHHKDLRNILERASARETAARVAAGSIAKKLLDEFGIYIASFVVHIGNAEIPGNVDFLPKTDKELVFPPLKKLSKKTFKEFQNNLEESPVRCPDPNTEKLMMQAIDSAKTEGDSLGGIFQVIAFNVPPGLGSHVHWDRRLDARLAYAVMSIPAIKGVEIGSGFASAQLKGSQMHDEIFYETKLGFYRKSNNAGGTEGGISNGENIIVKAAMKPIPSLTKPLRSVDIESKEPFEAAKERADVCAVPAAGVVGEAVVAVEIANAMLEKFGGDSLSELRLAYDVYTELIKNLENEKL
ncbi:chorismate synthase [Candidatus Poribacteria bacterium]|nr:chorismate synthase [Candidatus Poribacteria bacterium]